MSTGDALLAVGGLLLAALGTALSDDRSRGPGAAGLLLLALALAAWGAGSPPGAEPTPVARLGRGFLVGNGGLLLLGTALAVVAAFRTAPARLQFPARLAVAAGIALLAPLVAEFVAAAGPLRAIGAAVAIGLIGTSVGVGVRALVGRGPVRRFARRLAAHPLEPQLRGAPVIPVVALALAFAAAAAAPHLGVLFVAVPIAGWAGYLGFQPHGARPLPVGPVLMLLLLPAYWLLATVTGPLGLSTEVLSRIPVSPAAELLLAPALMLPAWAASGLWPLQRQLPGALVAPVGALLLGRAALPLVAEGLEYWRPLAAPLVWLGLWNAAAHGRWPLLLSGAGLLGLVAGGTPAVVPAACLLAIGLVLEVARSAAAAPGAAAALRVAAWVAGTWCGLRVLEASLRGEVVYTAVGALGLALLVGSRAGAHAREAGPR